MIRWAIPTEAATALPENALDLLIALLPATDALDVRRFRRPEDRARCLLSRLAQRSLPSAALGVGATGTPPPHPPLRRAADGRGRPYLCRATALAENPDARDALEAAPNFNYSVSHEGEWVVLAAEPLALCGVDVAAPRAAAVTRAATATATARGSREEPQQQQHPYLESLALLRDSLTDAEWAEVQAPLRAWAGSRRAEKDDDGPAGGGGDETEQEGEAEAVAHAEAAFLRAWAVKEAYVKARGDGLAFAPLSRIDAVWRADVRFADARAVASAAAAGTALAVGTLRIDGGAALWGRWAVAVHPLPCAQDEEAGHEGGGDSSSSGPLGPGPRVSGMRRRAWAAVVRGPPSGAAPRELHPDFFDSLSLPGLDGEQLRAAVERAPWMAFRTLRLEDLLLCDGEREALAAAVALAAGRGDGSGGGGGGGGENKT